jgi:multiple sugar transport system substrate-binding protein
MAAATPALAMLLSACGGGSGGGGGGTLNRALRLHHDAAVGPLFEPYVKHFNEAYSPLRLETSYVTQDYFGTTQTQLAGGSVDYDVLFADVGYLQKWYDAGWIRSIEDMEGIDEILGALPEGADASLRAADGTLVSLPYYVGTDVFIYNADHLDQIGAAPPATWEEMIEQCRELKSKGIAATPYSPFWTKDFSMMWYQLNDWAMADGAADFFDDSLAPQFQDDPVVASTIERWKTLYDEGLVPKDILTTDYGNTVNIFGGGKSTFTHQYQLELLGFNNPENSKVAGSAKNALMPGSTHTTLSSPAFWFMTATTPEPAKAWDLMSYLAATDKDGEYYVPQKLIATDLGLGTPYEAVNSDADVKASWGEWSDIDLLLEQMSNSKQVGPAVNQSWFPTFQETIAGLLQEAVLGRKSIPDALKEAAAAAGSS